MKGIDVLIVRFLPFVLFAILCVNLICCWFRYEAIIDTYELHSNSVIYALSLFLISLSNKKYHCVYNRAMYAFLIFLPIVNFVDSAICLFPTDRAYMLVVVLSYAITALITAYLAIRHFIQMSKRRLEHGGE